MITSAQMRMLRNDNLVSDLNASQIVKSNSPCDIHVASNLKKPWKENLNAWEDSHAIADAGSEAAQYPVTPTV